MNMKRTLLPICLLGIATGCGLLHKTGTQAVSVSEMYDYSSPQQAFHGVLRAGVRKDSPMLERLTTAQFQTHFGDRQGSTGVSMVDWMGQYTDYWLACMVNGVETRWMTNADDRVVVGNDATGIGGMHFKRTSKGWALDQIDPSQ